MKYFGAHGTLRGHVSGLYIVEATSLESARRKLHPSVYQSPSRPRPWYLIEGLQEIKGEWAEVLSDTLDQIRNREEEYYTDLGNEVFYVEI